VDDLVNDRRYKLNIHTMPALKEWVQEGWTIVDITEIDNFRADGLRVYHRIPWGDRVEPTGKKVRKKNMFGIKTKRKKRNPGADFLKDFRAEFAGVTSIKIILCAFDRRNICEAIRAIQPLQAEMDISVAVYSKETQRDDYLLY